VQSAAGITTDPRHPKYGLHSLRHAASSLFIEQGFSRAGIDGAFK
jgi:hypothetical protein